MKRMLIAASAVVTLIIVALVSYDLGKQHVIDNQVITDEQCSNGFYYSSVDGERYSYWYE